ncbi:hypothetical protein PDJAM_G00101960 [Pangasius djambal]|uniref:Uncharacterized protein n=1 Tax=Pangasius djambal TaxID=1691987 RepID=A0ACC5Z8H8_9TELE|nr:hypothetical protein [Pangasius djambal]
MKGLEEVVSISRSSFKFTLKSSSPDSVPVTTKVMAPDCASSARNAERLFSDQFLSKATQEVRKVLLKTEEKIAASLSSQTSVPVRSETETNSLMEEVESTASEILWKLLFILIQSLSKSSSGVSCNDADQSGPEDGWKNFLSGAQKIHENIFKQVFTFISGRKRAISEKNKLFMDVCPKTAAELEVRSENVQEPAAAERFLDKAILVANLFLCVSNQELEHKVITLIKNELKRFRKLLSPDYPACTERELEDDEDLHSVRAGALKITLHVLKNMNHTDLAKTLQNKLISEYQQTLKSNLKEKCKRINEGISQHGSSALLNEIYTELYITEGWSGDINNEHEVRQIETVSRRPATQETPIKCNDLFKDKSIRTVLTKGVAGIGKTVSVQKFFLDWAEGKANQDVTFIFPLAFRELNLMKQENLSLMNLLHHFFPEIRKKLELIDCDSYKVMFIFDGLDECRLPLNFQNNERLCDVTESASVDVLLTNLIKGNLLPSALLWITSRPGAANQIPPECVDLVTEELEHKVITLIKNELKRFRKLLSPDYPACTERELEDDEDLHSVRAGALKITLHVLKNMNHTDLAKTLQNKLISEYQQTLKSNLKEKCKRINEGISQHGSSALLNEIYTELYITEGWSGDINNEHEVRQIETVSRRPATQETPIKCNELFKDKSIRSVLTKGVAGIGKTVSVQKFFLDWAEGKANQDVTFIFPLAFRELNLMKQENLSLMNLLHHFFPEIRKKLELIDCDSYKVMFIFDGLDECRLPLNFQNNERLCDVTESASVDVLLTNLIKGNLLPSALLWITSRPGAANQIPPECVDLVTEVRGFNDPQKEEYFRKRISDQSLANQIITHMKSSRSLYIMCHIPVFCWISATVLERMLGEAESGEIPKTLTQMFTHFLIFQIKHKDQKYHQKCDPDPQQTRESILALGKLAFQQLEKGNLIFYEEDLRECGIDKGGSSHSKQETVKYIKEKIRENPSPEKSINLFHCLNELNDHSLVQEVQTYLNKEGYYCLSGTRLSPAQWSALMFVLLNSEQELDEFNLGKYDPSEECLLRLLPVVKASRKSELCLCNLTEESCRALSSVLSSNYSSLRELNLSNNNLQDSGVKLLSAGLENPHCKLEILSLRVCNLTEESCRVLSSVLSSNSSSLRELNLNNNKLQDSGVKLLSAGLENPHCTLEILRMCNCSITDEGCVALALALRSNPSSHLIELNLNDNKTGESGVKLLSDLLNDPHCKLEKLL